ncbi:MAG: hypothetical protein QXY45_03765 [Candidatus Aenigmatarchaeota archaeon]
MKGFTLSIILVLITITIVEVIMVQREISSEKREKFYLKNRINGMNDLYSNIITDSEKSMNIIAKRAISIAINHVIKDGIPVEEANETIKDLMIDGTFNTSVDLLMEGSRLIDWVEKMEEIAGLKGYQLRMSFTDLRVKPYDSFNLLVEGDISINITDVENLVSINRNKTVSVLVSIEGFEDPIYPLNTNGRVTRKIYNTKYSNFTKLFEGISGGNNWVAGISFSTNDSIVAENYQNKSNSILVFDDPTLINQTVLNQYKGLISREKPQNTTLIPYVYGVPWAPNNTYLLVDGAHGKVWEIENFSKHIEGGYYYPSSSGPSLLDRLEGKMYLQPKYLSQKTTGIESFVNKTTFIYYKIPVENGKTNVDYLYFSNSTQTGKGIKGIDPSVKIDDNHSKLYGVEDILVG